MGKRERNRSETRARIADAAARLATERGVEATTADGIAREAGVGRATFFRYFDSKERAVATGLSEAAVYVLAGILAEVPAELGPLAAVRTAYARLGEDFEAHRALFLDQALLCRSSPAMVAWTLHLYLDWEAAIAEAVAPRFGDLRPDDPRPRIVGALTMAATRLALDAWVADDARGDLPALVQHHLGAVEVKLDEGVR